MAADDYGARMRLGLVAATVVVAITVTALGWLPSAPAQSEIDAATAAIDDASRRLDDLLARLEQTQQRGNELAADYWWSESTLELLDGRIHETEQQRSDLDYERAGLMVDVKAIAVDRYMARGLALDWGDTRSISDRAAAEALVELLVGDSQAVLDRLAIVDGELADAAASLETQRDEQRAALAEVADTQRLIQADLDELARIQGAIEGELAALDDALSTLHQAEAERLAAAEAERVAAAQRKAEEAAARAVAPPTPLPVPSPTPTPTPTPPNPQPSEPLSTGPGAGSGSATSPVAPISEPTATPLPNPTPSEPLTTPTPAPPPAPTVAAAPAPTSGIRCPLAGPFTHTDDFNSPRAVGGIHRANDLISATGTPVIAVVSGVVEHRSSSVGGLSAHLDGDDGNYYFFTHLHGYENVDAGHVPAGTVIGYVGMTGNAPIPHLHFEIHTGGRGNYVNPYPQVRAACGT